MTPGNSLTLTADDLRAMITRHHPDLGERFLLPSGQTAGRFEDAIYAWSH